MKLLLVCFSLAAALTDKAHTGALRANSSDEVAQASGHDDAVLVQAESLDGSLAGKKPFPTSYPTKYPTKFPTAYPTGSPTETEKCPKEVWKRATDKDKMTFTDVNGDLFKQIAPTDNAGYWTSKGWNGVPIVTPNRKALKGTVYPVGTSYKIFELEDAAGNTEACKIKIVVEDKQPPVANCPNTQTYNFLKPNSGCKVDLSWTIPTPSDNDDVKKLKVEGPVKGSFTPGSYKYQVNVEDPAGNKGSCNFNVVVSDKAEPAFKKCGAKKDEYLYKCNAAKDQTVVVDFECSATDNCDSVTPVYKKWVKVTGKVGFHAGLHQQKQHTSKLNKCIPMEEKFLYEVCKKQAFCVVDAKKKCAYDIKYMTDEVVDALGDKEVYFYNKNNKFPVAVDTVGSASKSLFAVTAKAKDASGNKNNSTFTFSTSYGTEKPTFKYCPPAKTVLTYDETQDGVLAGYKMPEVSSKCYTKLEEARGMTPKTKLTAGVHDFHYTVTDAGGNKAVCSFQIEVQDKAEIMWDAPPSGVSTQTANPGCPKNIKLETDPKLGTSAIATWETPVPMFRGKPVTSKEASIDWGIFKSGMAFPIGSTKVSFTINDNRGHMAKTKIPCEFEIEVVDKEKPNFSDEAPQCEEGADGVPTYSQCDGVKINHTYDTKTNQVSDATVVQVTNTCCNPNDTCKAYAGSTQVSLCQPKK